jgi:hypothetical protein
MQDLCSLMETNDYDDEDVYQEYDRSLMDDTIQEQLFNIKTFGMAMTYGDMLAEEEAEALSEALDAQNLDSAFEMAETVQEERISLKNRNTINNALAFERYVYEKCGIKS